MSSVILYSSIALVGVVFIFFVLLAFALTREKDWLISLSVGVILITLLVLGLGSLTLINKKAHTEYAQELEEDRQEDIKPLLKDKELIARSLDNNSLDYDEVKALLRAGEVLNIYGLEEKIAKFEKDEDNISKAKLEFEIERIMKEL